jgi:hypothetical protein
MASLTSSEKERRGLVALLLEAGEEHLPSSLHGLLDLF